ncbi:MAG: Holliday junction DNA helicase RuvA [Candidatus Wildermuthbacteria bacterium RIFCSPHIGHO2_01_FULL_47_27]|uniref:Holliday junction branch migration complex subunit RuvA n=2 Tax=Candidatus Wildermuthiibacteriota TaxID=1817923 RepID=A0A1G2RLM7_9BACT|nr:MAG: Holliday junction DNA helicase RuvA [Candidatus Wildermuthbacteria bacterium RIFCSPHIGHO2_01_FULL_47_27]OHA68297.1 MAG: Holliday junction DNA helicase RuvA [Candidatus Wildermuthbacteria bacterium RIFCSPHIGHO2_02_FULL_47_17]OHA73750.1 MAG: Holliday junction DNA helicase RuvA [Candidatus Wildermuthbacteria bacterium RIFCSPLOWO2_01_FULL_48_35]
MIAYLQGTIIFRGGDFVVLDANGVGYKVFLTEKTLSNLPKNDEFLKLYTYFHLREETAEIYGFLTYGELQLFETLNNVSGIGPRTALILSSFGSLEQLKAIIDRQDAKALQNIKGIGTKKLQKIALEITGKITEMGMRPSVLPAEEEAVGALISLGFSRQQAKAALADVAKEIQDPQERLKEALKLLGRYAK